MARGKSSLGLLQISGAALLGAAVFLSTGYLYAFPQNQWNIQSGERLEVLRDYMCFDEGQAGEIIAYKVVRFSGEVLSAEVFISGFKMWYTQEGNDHEVMQERVDA
jgi:hypothetical protein